MKKTYIGTSWKMNKTLDQSLLFCEQFKKHLITDLQQQIQPFIIPPFTTVREVTNTIKNNQINCLIGVQNMHFEDTGAFTGEISPIMVKDTGAYLVEIGHSERREFFGETDLTVHKKVRAALKHGLKPLVCIGDSAQEKAWNISAETVIKQMKAAIFGLHQEQIQQVIIAYEPIWAIGENGIPATAEEAETIHKKLREALTDLYGKEIADNIHLLYGGSVNSSNCAELINQPNIDGLFIGRSAWQADSFCNILSIINRSI
ncbi:triose-phosphate isomerase [Orbus mooreae]|uniref:triose-phosphate isomerase n=1 Tax=Orbus mooreae TaxID=3074107 RepID=UPI00370D14DE